MKAYVMFTACEKVTPYANIHFLSIFSRVIPHELFNGGKHEEGIAAARNDSSERLGLHTRAQTPQPSQQGSKRRCMSPQRDFQSHMAGSASAVSRPANVFEKYTNVRIQSMNSVQCSKPKFLVNRESQKKLLDILQFSQRHREGVQSSSKDRLKKIFQKNVEMAERKVEQCMKYTQNAETEAIPLANLIHNFQ